MEQLTRIITQEVFNKGLSYPAYRSLIKSLLENSKTTGVDHSEAMIAYTKMNDSRMNRWDKKIVLGDEITAIVQKLPMMNWLVITEGWCGDAAQNIPYMAKLASENPAIKLKLILRDENPEIMEAYLTNGAKSIPILIMMDENFNEIAQWGPRPKPVQEMVMEAKNTPDLNQQLMIESIHKWYANDKMHTIENEFLDLLKKI